MGRLCSRLWGQGREQNRPKSQPPSRKVIGEGLTEVTPEGRTEGDEEYCVDIWGRINLGRDE